MPPLLANLFPFSQDTTENLSDKVLLKIFCYFLDVSPRHWPRLVHVCRKWRRIVLASQQVLHLRLFCTHGTPVQKTLDCWPAALPIVVAYGGSPELDPPAPEDEDNIMTALKQSDRVRSISLTATNSLLEKLSAIERPFSELEDLVLLSQDSVPLTLPSAFRWGQRLRCLHLTRIVVPELLRRFHFSKDLVDIQLHDTGKIVYLLPEALASGLSGMTQLRSLSLHHPSSTSNLDIFTFPAGRARVALPALTHFNFRGTSRFFDRFTAKMDYPLLTVIEITFDQSTFIGSRLDEFLGRIKM